MNETEYESFISSYYKQNRGYTKDLKVDLKRPEKT